MKGQYDDIIDLPHHVSARHPKMPMPERAAQFSPFMALTGYEDVIRETARLTEQKPEFSENVCEELEGKMRILAEHIAEHPEITVSYFLPDERKEGGSMVRETGRLKKIDETERIIRLENGSEIKVDDILEIESEIFGAFSGELF